MDFNRESNVDLGKREEASEGEERGSHETEEGKAAREAERERKTSQQTDDKSNDDLESFFGHKSPSARESSHQKDHKMKTSQQTDEKNNDESFFGHKSPSARESSHQKDHKIDDDLESFFGHQSISAREPLQQTHHKHGDGIGAERERKASQQTDDKSNDDLESFFGHPAASARESSQQRDHKIADDLEAFFAQSSTSASSAWPKPASMNNSSNVYEPARTGSGPATPAANVDDWITILGAAPSFDESQSSRREDQGVSSGRKNERLERTRESAANAISEIRRRDQELQRQQAEKQRAGVLLEAEIKRWSGGKEGNLRVLLSTLHDVLWPECGWTAVSLSDLINPASVKMTYRKAMLHVHPDKVQQKGATAQQRYIAESIFNLLKEAFSKFNSQELF